MGTGKRGEHIDYVYLSDLPKTAGFEVASAIIDGFLRSQRISPDDENAGFMFNVVLTLDDMTGNWSFKFSSVLDFGEEYTFKMQ